MPVMLAQGPLLLPQPLAGTVAIVQRVHIAPDGSVWTEHRLEVKGNVLQEEAWKAVGLDFQALFTTPVAMGEEGAVHGRQCTLCHWLLSS